MHVDEARRNGKAFGFDDPLGGQRRQVSQGDDPVTPDSDVAQEGRVARPVHNAAAPNDKIHVLRGRQCRCDENSEAKNSEWDAHEPQFIALNLAKAVDGCVTLLGPGNQNRFRLPKESGIMMNRVYCTVAFLMMSAAGLLAQTVTATVGAGTNPFAAAVNSVTNKTYVANYGSNNVTMIDGATNNTTTIAAGTNPSGVAVNTVTNKIYVSNHNSNNITVIDGSTNTTATVTAGTNPYAIAVNPVTNKIYVTNANSNNVTVIDGASNTTVAVAVGTYPIAVAVNAVTNKIYVANQSSNSVTVIDGATNSTTTVAAGSLPVAVAVNSATNKIYVANEGSIMASSTVTVIDGATNTTTTVAAGIGPYAVAVNPVTNNVYVANFFGGNVTVIAGATNTTTTVVTGTLPNAVAINPVSNEVYVSNAGSNSVTVINGATNGTTTLPVGTAPSAVAVNPVTGNVYVANYSSNNVTVIDGATNTVAVAVTSVSPASENYGSGAAATVTATLSWTGVGTAPTGGLSFNSTAGGSYGTPSCTEPSPNTVFATVNVGSNPEGVAFDSANGDVYVANESDNTVSAINGSTNTVVATVNVGSEPAGVAVDTVNGDVYVANRGANTVSVINGSTNTVVATITVGSGPGGVAFDATTGLVYVPNSGGNTVSVIDGNSDANENTVVATVNVGSYPDGVAYDAASGDVYVANDLSNTVSVINGSTNTVIATINVDSGPLGIAFAATNGDVYVAASTASNIVDVINGSTNTLVDEITVGSEPFGISYDATGGVVFVANRGSNTVSVITPNGSPITCTVAFTPAPTDAVGIYTLSARYAGDSNYVPASSPQINNFTITDATTTTLTSGTNPSFSTSSVAFTATVASQNGAITLSVGGTVNWSANTGCGASTVSGYPGVATCTTSSLAVGFDTVVATYSGDSLHVGSSGSVTQTVNRQTPTVTVTSVNPASESYGSSTQAVVTATLAWTGNGVAPTGNLSVGSTAGGSYDPVSCSGASSPITCTATFTPIAADAPGKYEMTASYAGDTNYNGSSSALANNFSIAQQAPLVAVSAVGPATETYGSLEPAVVNATITWTGTGAAPTGGLSLASTAPGSFGAVTCDSPNRKAPGTLLSTYDLTCTAWFAPTASDAAGTYTLSASYAGDSNYSAASSPQTNNFSITQTNTTTAVISFPNPSRYGQSVTFTATITPASGSGETGTVTWSANTGCGTSTVTSGNPGIATCTTSVLPAGTDAIRATYSGDSNHSGSTGTLRGGQVVNSAVTLTPTSLAFGNVVVGVTSAAKTVTLKNTGTATLKINSITFTGADAGDFASPSNTCGGSLAANASCTINVTFKPTAVGLRTAKLAVRDSATNSPQTVSLQGTGK